MHATADVHRERALRSAVLAGDEFAWRAWYDESFACVDSYVLWRCGGDRHLADDALQQAWVVAVRRIGDFDPERAAFRTWLRAIAANVVRDQLRRRRREPRHELPDLAAADDTARKRRVADALAAIPDRYEAALRAKYLDGMSVAEIAAANGESVKAVESLLTRAREAFRAAYEEDSL